MKKLFTFTIGAVLTINSFGQATWEWAQSSTLAYNNDVVNSVAADNNGNVYAVGYFYGASITFGSFTLTNINSSGGTSDIFIVKYDAGGTAQWAINAGSTDNDVANGVAVDGNGDVYVAGEYSGTYCAFGALQVMNGTSGGNMFIVKYNSSGVLQWAQGNGGALTGSGAVIAQSVAVDANGNAYITGNFGCPGFSIGLTSLTNASSSGTSDMFIAKYNTSGTAMWAKEAGSTGNDYGSGIAVDNNGKVYVTGTFHGGVAFGSFTVFTLGPQDMFIAKYDTIGNIDWAKASYGLGSDYGQSISTTVNNTVYVTGYYNSDSISFGTHTIHNNGGMAATNDMYLVQYDTAGTAIWATGAGGSDNDYGYGVSTDVAGGAYVTGSFSSTSIFTGGSMLTNSGTGTSDIFLAQYGSLGNVDLTVSAHGNDNDNDNDNATSLSVQGYLYAYIGGSFNSDTILFGTNTLFNANVGSTVYSDAFVAKIDFPTLGINTIMSDESGISIYPNPFTSQTTISFSEEQKNTVIKVVNIVGEEILQSTINSKQYTLNMSGISKGIYFVQIMDEKGNAVNRKVEVQ